MHHSQNFGDTSFGVGNLMRTVSGAGGGKINKAQEGGAGGPPEEIKNSYSAKAYFGPPANAAVGSGGNNESNLLDDPSLT